MGKSKAAQRHSEDEKIEYGKEEEAHSADRTIISVISFCYYYMMFSTYYVVLFIRTKQVIVSPRKYYC